MAEQELAFLMMTTFFFLVNKINKKIYKNESYCDARCYGGIVLVICTRADFQVGGIEVKRNGNTAEKPE